MPAWVMSADGGSSTPVHAVRELFVIHQDAQPDRGRPGPEYHVCASKTGERKGPYRVVAALADDGTVDAEDAAIECLEELTMLLADDSTTGVLRWADGWMLQVPADPDAVTEG